MAEVETRQQVANLEHITYTRNNWLTEAALLAFGHSKAEHKGGPTNTAQLAESTQPQVRVTTIKKRHTLSLLLEQSSQFRKNGNAKD